MTSSLLTSPTIAALRAQLADGNIAVLDQFWQHIADHGAPIIEPITNDANHALVTFVWRGDPDLKHVVVIGGIAGEDTVGNELLHLPNTDLWYRTYRVRNDTRTTYFFSPNDPLVPMTDERWEATWLAWVRGGNLRIDPFNANVLWSEESILTLPGAPPEAWLASQPDVPADTVDEHRFQSTLLENERTVWVYRPPGFNPHQEPYGWALFFDGDGYRYVPTPTILDNLIAAGRIPPLVAIFVANASYEERRQALSCNRQFNRFLLEELLPWARPRYHLTDDPQRTIVAGASYGGLAAAYAAFQHPHIRQCVGTERCILLAARARPHARPRRRHGLELVDPTVGGGATLAAALPSRRGHLRNRPGAMGRRHQHAEHKPPLARRAARERLCRRLC